MTIKPYYQSDRVTLYHGDCLAILPTLGAGSVDAVVTDPPYGLNKSWGTSAGWQGKCGKGRLWNGTPEWDKFPASDVLINECLRVSNRCIVWGGNYFGSLPPQKGWLVWDKCAAMTQAQAELAWSNCVPTVRVFRKSPLGVWGNGGKNGELKIHPTQKPIELMTWCLSFLPDGCTILDPFAGSGTTGVACVKTGRKFIGIEIDEKYCEIAAKRIQAAERESAERLVPA